MGVAPRPGLPSTGTQPEPFQNRVPSDDRVPMATAPGGAPRLIVPPAAACFRAPIPGRAIWSPNCCGNALIAASTVEVRIPSNASQNPKSHLIVSIVPAAEELCPPNWLEV